MKTKTACRQNPQMAPHEHIIRNGSKVCVGYQPWTRCSHEGSPNHGITHFDYNTGHRWREERRIEPDIAEQMYLGQFTEEQIRAKVSDAEPSEKS